MGAIREILSTRPQSIGRCLMKHFLLVDLSLNEITSEYDYSYDAFEEMKELTRENSHEYRVVKGMGF